MTSKKQLTKAIQLIIACILIFSFQAQSKGYFPTKNSTPPVEKTVIVKKKKVFRLFRKIKKIFSKKSNPSEDKSRNSEAAIIAFIFTAIFISMGFVLGSALVIGIGCGLLALFLFFAFLAILNKEKKGLRTVKIFLGVSASALGTIIYLLPTKMNPF
jgi:VIT1/CCC1 family predicted Fe2+/Mn2+ transporter